MATLAFVLSVLLPAPACLSPSYQSRPPPAGSYQTLLQPFSNRLPLRILSLSGTISLSFVCCPTTVQHNTAVKRSSSLGIGLVFFAHYQSVRERCGSAQCLRAAHTHTYTYTHTILVKTLESVHFSFLFWKKSILLFSNDFKLIKSHLQNISIFEIMFTNNIVNIHFTICNFYFILFIQRKYKIYIYPLILLP